MSSRADRIHSALQVLQPSLLEIHDDSHKHAGHHAVAAASGETHFRVVVVSPQFRGMQRVARHRKVQALLKPEFDGGLHALQIQARTPEESGGGA